MKVKLCMLIYLQNKLEKIYYENVETGEQNMKTTLSKLC